ncbi:MAG: phage holin family protein [Rikenellaceae bacterium]|nr:phage holin family protein [Rikenellaceae bacterium]
MNKQRNATPTGLVSEDVKEYISLRIQSLKLTAVENLSTFVSGAFGVLVFALCLMVALLLLTFGFTLWLGEMLGSHALAFAIVGGVFLVVSLVAYLLRDRLIADSMVRHFSRMFFTTRQNAEDDE